MSADEEISKEFLDRITQLAERIEDVDIIKRHQTVLDSLNTLRIGKKKLIRQLQLLLDNDSDVQLTNDLINKIIQSFNELRKQEQEFTLSMKEVVLKFCGDLDELLPKLSDIQKVLKTDEENNFAELKVLEVNRLTLKLQNIQQMIFGFNSMFKEAEIASNYLDQQLTTRLSIYFEKKKQKSLVQQLREKSENSNSSSNDKIAHHHIKFINSNTNCNSNSERRQRQLERLRREAAKRGLNKVEEDNETCNISLLTTKVSADLVNNDKEDEKTLAEDERIPPIPQLPEKEMCTSNLDKKKDDLPSKISERFSSLAARKHKMRLIQSKLSNLQQQKMENTYDEAVNRYKFLSEMRKKLEGLQISASTSAEASDQVSDDTKDDVNQLDGPKDEQKNTPNDDLDNEVNVKDNLTSDC